jgi:prephenate dehydratase|tara:strand:- start:254 stop:442 length:189 start_codon:yes stop_codon:yes gene_type:complete
MEEFDTTTPEKTESERQAALIHDLDGVLAKVLRRLRRLDIRIANLESRRMLQNDPNDDEEWY